MKRQCVGCEIESSGDCPRWHALGSGLHKQAKHVKAIILGKCGQGRDNIRFFHISVDIEMMGSGQVSFQHSLKCFESRLAYEDTNQFVQMFQIEGRSMSILSGWCPGGDRAVARPAPGAVTGRCPPCSRSGHRAVSALLPKSSISNVPTPRGNVPRTRPIGMPSIVASFSLL